MMTHDFRSGAPGLIACALASFLATSHSSVGVNLTDHGGVCNGATDNSAAIALGLADAKAKNLPLVIPTGQCNFSDIIRLDGVKLTGNGASSVLYATNWQRSAIFMSGAAPSVSNVKLTGVSAPSRQAPWEMTKITVFGATDFVIDRVVIEGSPAAGIQTAQAPTRGRITNNVVRNTLSDGIHITGVASHILVEANLVEYTGDDGIAVVSYRSDAGRVNNVTARNNVVRNNRFGRNMSVVGGSQVLYQNNLMQNNLAGLACLYIAQEGGGMPTQGNDDVKVERNTLENCGGPAAGHAAVMIFSDGNEANNNIWLLYNDIRQSGRAGIRVYSPRNLGVRLEANRITGASLPLNVSSPSTTVIPYTSGPVGYVSP
ncbi:right-handed parallel beta-helix repeat-containing protein [Caenimonas soli]|uniref:right-handed parallel beta-helix repeat-containing protein n=1 Tax=Caenimonas soli TaxID=2735555 RepID=UPI0015566122|nr:right-handed parallel beta-helix repeat-containing protein [Caenimonas soli]NPC57475.1 hypothetical protein [Caenimonas soli]